MQRGGHGGRGRGGHRGGFHPPPQQHFHHQQSHHHHPSAAAVAASSQSQQMELRNFVFYLRQNITELNVYEIHNIYENHFNRLTEKYFSKEPWPAADVVAPLVDNDPVFLILYKELYYRHIYAKLQPSLEQRFESWDNYCDLFNLLLGADDTLSLDLPYQWMWDIVDEFVYQFQSFCQHRSKIRGKKPEEIELLKQNEKVWNPVTVIHYLMALIERSRVSMKTKKVSDEDEDDDIEAGQLEETQEEVSNIHRMMGYFSVVGLARVHCLFGDYYSVLKVLESIDITRKGLFSRVLACHSTVYYYLGFSYFMLRRYSEAIKAFTNVLFYLSRAKQNSRSYQTDAIAKKTEQMYSLLAIAMTLSPQRIDENVLTTMKEKMGDEMQRLYKGDEALLAEKFAFACPKFISPVRPDYDSQDAISQYNEPLRMQQKAFMNSVRQQLMVPTIRSFLKLYTSIEISKLAAFLEVDADVLRQYLLCYKHKTRSRVVTKWTSAEVEFYVDKDMVHVADTKVHRRFGDYFIRNINKLEDVMQEMERTR